MIEKVGQSNLLDGCDQVVIYGANGWMGRSALDFLSSISLSATKRKVLLIGSRSSSLEINKEIFEINDPAEGLKKIEKNAIFYNAAFIRREFLQKMTPKEYLHKNEEIAKLPINALRGKKLFSFINLSSGVARNLDLDSGINPIDDYARLKKDLELEYADLGSKNDTAIINCRIFSLSGSYLNEFENLAISSFIKQAKEHNRMTVLSPNTKRTYIDATNLAETLLTVGSKGKDSSFDSGGALVTMRELAESIKVALNKDKCELTLGNEESPDYFGDYEEFNAMASNVGQNLYGIGDQILRTLKAFN